MIGWLVAAVALGCGGMFGPEGADVFSDAQQAIFEVGDGYVDVTYRVDYGGNPSEFGWVIPVPGDFVDLYEADEERFDALRRETAPAPRYIDEDAGGGCGPAAKGGDNALRSGGSSNYTIVGSGRAGVFEYTALTGESPVAITEWLETNGWVVGESLPTIEDYTEEGGWTFVAVRLVDDLGEGDGGLAALRIRYEGHEMRFPSRMSQYSTVPEQATTVYVVGDQRAHLNGWELTSFPDGETIGDWSYDEVLREAVTGGEPTYAVVFANELDGQWVTRFDTIAPRIDVYASEQAREDEEKQGGCAIGSTRATGALWLVALGALAARRRAG